MFNFTPVLKKLFPDGRAFRFYKGSDFEALIKGLAIEPDRVCTFYDEVKKSGIPDGNIPDDALSDWETFLAIKRNDSLTSQERNERITGKYVAQGGQGSDYIQQVLQDAGFPVYVQENIPSLNPGAKEYTSRLGGIHLGETTLGAYTDRIDPRSKTGILIDGSPIYETKRLYNATLGGFSLGGLNLGGYVGTAVIPKTVAIPAIPSQYIFVWFLTGINGIDDFVDIPVAREQDFKELVLQLKPAHTWVLAQVNFI